MDPPHPTQDHKPYPVLDTLEKTRLEHHEEPFPQPHHPSTARSTGAHPLDHIGSDVVDHILQQVEAVPLTKDCQAAAPMDPFATVLPLEQQQQQQQRQQDSSGEGNPVLNTATKPNKVSSPPKSPTLSEASPSPPHAKSKEDRNIVEPSTVTKVPGSTSTWQSFASMSSNQLPSGTILDSMDGTAGLQHEHEHDKPSVLPEILPGFKGRMADIHHATLKSVTEGSGAAIVHTNHPNGKS